MFGVALGGRPIGGPIPASIGAIMLARGKITEELLRDGLAEQERSHENLGVILTRMGVLSQAELTRQITA